LAIPYKKKSYKCVENTQSTKKKSSY